VSSEFPMFPSSYLTRAAGHDQSALANLAQETKDIFLKSASLLAGLVRQ
jgi:hypothetical protein